MICVSIAEPTLAENVAALRGLDLVEIRIDRTGLTPLEVKELFSRPVKLIATCRPGTRPDEERLAVLLAAIHAGAAYVDVELEGEPRTKEMILKAAREKSCRIIMSYHNLNE